MTPNSLPPTALQFSYCRRPLESPRSCRPPKSSFPRRRNPEGRLGGKTAASLDTKACPGLRSGMNRSRHDRLSRHAGVRCNPLALVMPAPQSSFRRRPESRGAVGGKTAASLGTKACPGLRSGIRGTSQTDESRSFRTICYPCARCTGVWGEGQGLEAGPPIVIPAKAGIQRGGGRIPSRTPHSSCRLPPQWERASKRE